MLSLPSCHSTNDILAKLVPKRELFEGAVVVADHQTAGKGQRGNSWEAEPGKNLTFSILLKPTFLAIEEQFYLYIISALGIYDFLKEYMSQGIQIKWPNDVLYYDSKIAGVLIENTIRSRTIDNTIVGIGLNINQIEFKNDNAVSLAMLCKQEFQLEALLQELVLCLEKRYLQLKNNKQNILMEDYLAHLYWLGEKRMFHAGEYFTGEIQGIDERGRLKILSNGRIRLFNFKEVSFVK